MVKIYDLNRRRQQSEQSVTTSSQVRGTVDGVSAIAEKILRHTNTIKHHFSRMLKLNDSWDGENERVKNAISNCRMKIYSHCQNIANIRNREEIDDEKWSTIIEQSLQSVHKHRDSEETRQKLETLMSVHFHDATPESIWFIRSYLKIVGNLDISEALGPIRKK